jgi:glycosyltransferase involved in cell wall biosynthesis
MKYLKILFITNNYARYRKPIFHLLADKLRVQFLFTNEKKIDDLKGSHKVLRKYGIKPFALTFGLISVLLFGKYDLVIFPPADSPGELFDNLVCFLTTRIRGKPYLIWSERWLWKEDKKSIIRRLYLAFDEIVMGFIFRKASACVTDGKKHKAYLLSLNVSENKIFIAPPASVIDGSSDSANGSKIKERLGIGKKKVILYVGRLIKLKGVNYLIEAFSKIRAERDDVHLIIVGGEGLYGKTREERFSIDDLKDLSKKLGLKLDLDISFLGDVVGKDLAGYFLICNVFVLPGITHVIGDAWGLVLNEAMQFGKPVISTDAVGAAFDLIEEGINGFMVPEKDVGGLYEALNTVLSDPRMEEKMGDESRKIIRGYTYENMFKGFDTAIDYACKLNEK